MDGFSKYHFRDLGKSEKIVRVLHRNWFYLAEQFFLLFVIAAVFYGALIFIPVFYPVFVGSQSKQFLLFFENFVLLALWIYGFMIWIDYYFDIWIITDQRIINIEQKGMFSRKVSETEYSKIQDITTEVKGFLPTIINFGDVRIQTAAEDEQFVFRTISDPYQIKNIISQMQKKCSAEATDQLGEMIKEKIGA